MELEELASKLAVTGNTPAVGVIEKLAIVCWTVMTDVGTVSVTPWFDTAVKVTVKMPLVV